VWRRVAGIPELNASTRVAALPEFPAAVRKSPRSFFSRQAVKKALALQGPHLHPDPHGVQIIHCRLPGRREPYKVPAIDPIG
jgi:hypothetical protein